MFDIIAINKKYQNRIGSMQFMHTNVNFQFFSIQLFIFTNLLIFFYAKKIGNLLFCSFALVLLCSFALLLFCSFALLLFCSFALSPFALTLFRSFRYFTRAIPCCCSSKKEQSQLLKRANPSLLCSKKGKEQSDQFALVALVALFKRATRMIC